MDLSISRERRLRGFTLLELLIVIAIIAILSAILIFVLNPTETLRRGRDSQRIGDLKTIHRAIALYITDSTIAGRTALIGTNEGVGGPGPVLCSDPHISTLGDRVVRPSYSGDGRTGNNISGPGSLSLGTAMDTCSGTAYLDNSAGRQDDADVDGTGWVEVNFSAMSSGSPIPRLPFDPSFKVVDPVDPNQDDFLYTYTCLSCRNPSVLVYELNANLESADFRNGGAQDKESTDGGDNPNLFEAGTNLSILKNP